MRKEFVILGEKIEVDSQRVEYTKYRKKFRRLASEQKNKFTEIYKTDCTNMESVARNVEAIGEGLIVECIEELQSILVNLDIYTYNEETLTKRFINDYYTWDEEVEEALQPYFDIVLSEEDKDKYRTMRRQQRGKWEGGGFGVQGAVKGATTAGALNMASGATHMVFNGIAKIGSSISASMKIAKVYNDPDLLENLEFAIYCNCFWVHLLAIDILVEEKVLKYSGGTTKQDREKYGILVKNLQEDKVSDAKKSTVIKQLFELNPYDDRIYKYLITNYGISREIVDMADFFGVDIEDTFKQSLNQYISNMPQETLKDIDDILEYIDEAKNVLNTNYIKELSDRYLLLWQEKDAQRRTFEGVVYDTDNELDIAKKEREKFRTLKKQIDECIDIDTLKELLEKAESEFKVNKLIKEYLDKSNKRYRKLEQESRTLNGTTYGTREEYQQAAQEFKEVSAILARLEVCDDEIEATTILRELELGNYSSEGIQLYINQARGKVEVIKAKDRVYAGKIYETQEKMEIAKAEIEKVQAIKEEYLKNSNNIKHVKRILRDLEKSIYTEEESKLIVDEVREQYKILVKAKKKNKRIRRIIGAVAILGVFTVIGILQEDERIKKSDNSSTGISQKQQYFNDEKSDSKVDEVLEVVEVKEDEVLEVNIDEAKNLVNRYMKALNMSINESDISYVLPFIKQEGSLYEDIQQVIDTYSSNNAKQILYEIQIEDAIQSSADMPTEVRSKEIVGIVIGDKEEIYEYDVVSEIMYSEGHYYVEYRNIYNEELVEINNKDEESTEIQEEYNNISNLEGIIDEKYEIVFNLSDCSRNEYGNAIFTSYYKNHPDSIFNIEVVQNNNYGIILYEYYQGEQTGTYYLSETNNVLLGSFENEKTKQQMSVQISLD